MGKRPFRWTHTHNSLLIQAAYRWAYKYNFPTYETFVAEFQNCQNALEFMQELLENGDFLIQDVTFTDEHHEYTIVKVRLKRRYEYMVSRTQDPGRYPYGYEPSGNKSKRKK